MDTMEYLKIILDGYISDPSLLKEHLIRNQKKAEKESFITREEFIKRCYNVIAIFEKEIDSMYFARKNELYMCITLNKRDGKPYTDIEEEIKEMSKDWFNVLLHRLTRGQYLGHLFHNEVMFIKKCIDEMNNTSNEMKENKLSISEIALKCFYEGKFINRENADSFLIGSGHTSGDKLYNEFIEWSDNTDRKADPQSKVKLKNKIKKFETVIALLPQDKKTKAIDELRMLNNFMSNYQ
jgi:hypothetical protein